MCLSTLYGCVCVKCVYYTQNEYHKIKKYKPSAANITSNIPIDRIDRNEINRKKNSNREYNRILKRNKSRSRAAFVLCKFRTIKSKRVCRLNIFVMYLLAAAATAMAAMVVVLKSRNHTHIFILKRYGLNLRYLPK